MFSVIIRVVILVYLLYVNIACIHVDAFRYFKVKLVIVRVLSN